MSFAFDLISDLHVDTWPSFNWDHQATSPFCVVAGDISKERSTIVSTLKQLSKCYQAVFYIDGNDEHFYYLDNLLASYDDLVEEIERIPKVVYLQNNVVVVDGVAILGTNGWWGYDFNLDIDPDQAQQWFQEKYNLSTEAANNVIHMATNDAAYMISSIKRLQTHRDVKKIVMVTHTVPDPELISHDIDLEDNMRYNIMGNRYMMQALGADTEHKIHTWCFGHYHNQIDQIRSQIRFVNNCRGRGNTKYSQYAYYPKRIVID